MSKKYNFASLKWHTSIHINPTEVTCDDTRLSYWNGSPASVLLQTNHVTGSICSLRRVDLACTPHLIHMHTSVISFSLPAMIPQTYHPSQQLVMPALHPFADQIMSNPNPIESANQSAFLEIHKLPFDPLNPS